MSSSFLPHCLVVFLVAGRFLGLTVWCCCRTSTLGSIAWADHFAAVPTQAYKVSNAALHMLNKMYAIDLAGEGFKVLAVSLGVSRSFVPYSLACRRAR